nr:FAD:protein FMN transferase [Micromonospora tarensis]
MDHCRVTDDCEREVFARVLDALLREDHSGLLSTGRPDGADWWVVPHPAGLLRIPVRPDGFQQDLRGAAPLVLEMTAGAVGTSGVTGRQGHVVDPHTGEPADHLVAATVVGPDLTIADAYATALYAAGATGLAWFRGNSDYRALFAHRR